MFEEGMCVCVVCTLLIALLIESSTTTSSKAEATAAASRMTGLFQQTPKQIVSQTERQTETLRGQEAGEGNKPVFSVRFIRHFTLQPLQSVNHLYQHDHHHRYPLSLSPSLPHSLTLKRPWESSTSVCSCSLLLLLFCRSSCSAAAVVLADSSRTLQRHIVHTD